MNTLTRLPAARTTLFFDGRGGAGLNLISWETPHTNPVFIIDVRIHDRRGDVEARLGKPDLRLASPNYQCFIFAIEPLFDWTTMT
jgi:hypothetical protein